MSDFKITTAVIKVANEENTNFYRLKSSWDNDSLTINILYESTAWIGTETGEHLNNTAKQLKLDYETYRTNLQQYLSETNAPDIVYNLSNDKFIISKKINKIKIKYLVVGLNVVRFDTNVECFIDCLIDSNVNLQKRLTEFAAIKNEAENIRDESLRRLESYVDLHEKNEQHLYSSFVLLLNEKKQHIQHLNAIIAKLKVGCNITDSDLLTTDEESVVENYETPTKTNRIEKISDSDSSSHADDLEQPSTSKCAAGRIIRDDSPSPPLVPIKKLKAGPSPKVIGSKLQTNVAKFGETVEDNQQQQVAVTVVEESPTLDFNTQELLDRL